MREDAALRVHPFRFSPCRFGWRARRDREYDFILRLAAMHVHRRHSRTRARTTTRVINVNFFRRKKLRAHFEAGYRSRDAPVNIITPTQN